MSNIKKGSKLTVSTDYGISRDTSNNLGVLEVSGPAMSDVANVYGTNPAHFVIGGTDVSGILQLGINNDGNTFIDANTNNNHKDIIMQKYGGNVVVGTGAGSTAKVGIQTNTPLSTFHINSTDGLIIPVGTAGERPDPAYNGMIRYNTSTSQFEGYGPGSAWGSLGGVKDVDGDTYILAESSAGADNDALQFFTGGSERVVIDSSGYVGIGTSTPQTELDISGYITANTEEYAYDISFNNNASSDNWILFNSSYGNAGDVPVNTDWTIEYKHKITFGPSAAGDGHFGVVLEEDDISSNSYSTNTHFMYWQTDPSTNLTFRYQPADGTVVNELIPGTGYRWSLFSDHVNVKLEFLTKNNTIRLYFNGENVKTISNISNPSKIFGRWGFVEYNDNTHNIINPRITYGGKTYHLTTQHSTSTTAPTLTTTTKNVELINSNNNQINIPKLHSTELYADKMFVGRNNFNDYTFNAERKIVASDGAATDYFGYSVAIDGNYAIVGAREDDDKGTNSGSAYIFNVSTGAQLHKLVPSDGAAYDQFGWSVAISGNYAIVGAWLDDDNGTDSGSAYIFNVTTGAELHKLVPSDGAATDYFGVSVAISGNYAIVGANQDDDNGSSSGSAYIYNVTTGAQLHKLLASDGAANDYFGRTVAISGNYAIVGAYGDDDKGSASGSAYIYNVTTGAQLHHLLAEDGAASDHFGYSVAISGNYAIVGAYGDDDNGSDSGSAYIFNVTTGAQLHKLLASDGAANDRFGISVAISGNYAIVGAYYDDDTGTDSGSAYIFDVRSGSQVKKITPNDGAANDRFGYSVAISGNYAIVGAYYDDDKGSDSGSAYIYGPTASSSYLLNINDDGNIGIGTTEPKTELHVQGAITTDQLYAGTGAPTDYTFSIENKIVAHDGAASDEFGWSVAISGNYAIVAAYADDDKGNQSGSAYIYNVTTGAELHHLLASDGVADDRFGRSVAIDGNYAIVGAWLDDDKGTNSGSAYIFNVSTGAQLHKLVASDGAANDYFGHSVAISGNYAIVGAYADDDNGASSGSAYIFNVTTGAQLHKLIASDGAASDEFGISVAISDNYAIVGAYGDDDNGSNSGSAYIFNVSTGAQLHKLVAEDGAADDYFGVSVAISGNYAIVGAHYDDDKGSTSGSAYIYNVSTGAQLHKLVPSDGAAYDYFGVPVAISGNYAIVGAHGNDDNGSTSGSAYIFDVRSGSQVKKITPNDGAANDRFGYSVAISDNYAIVGAYYDDDNGSNSGSAYIYGPNDLLPPLLSIDNDSGNVGIGTTEPKSLLDVNGTLQATTLTSTNLKVGRDFSFSDETKILAHDGVASDYFGVSVAISGNYAIVGANLDADNGLYSGSAYIFNVTTGAQLHKLIASDGAASDEFGRSVAISGNYAIVGARLDDDNGTDSGSAYIFNVSTGAQLHKLVPSDGAANDYFGISVAISGNYAIVGALYNDDNGANSGSAYIYNVSTGAQLHKLTASDGSSSDEFGFSVAIDGNYAIVAAWLDDTNGGDAGSAYIFNVTAGAQLHKLVASDRATNDYFGVSVAISGNYAIVGAHSDDDKGTNSGSAYIFNVTTGAQLHKLIASDGAASDYFGRTVAISGNYAIVGAWSDDDKGTNSGSVYIYNVTTGAELHKLLASDGAANDRFGESVAISGNYAIVGAYAVDDNGANSGSAYIFGPSSPYLLSIEDGVTDIPNLVTTGLTSGNFNAGRDFSFSDETKILAHDGAANDHFGYSVAISGNYAIVGARLDADNGLYSGSVYIFNVTTGAQLHKLLASDGAGSDEFGWSVAISGNYAIVGAREDDDNGTNSGSAYIFNVSTGAQLHKLVASDGATTDEFGFSVAISGNYAIVAAYADDDKGNQSGSAYIYNVTTGAELHHLLASDGVADDRFGRSVAIDGNYAIVGAFLDDDKGSASGSAYIYNVSTGAQLHKLLASDGATNDRFGISVAISGNYAIVGAYYDDDNGTDSGSAYIYNVSTGAQLHKLIASGGAASDQFGYSVAISGNYAIVGAVFDDDKGSNSGSAYIFNVSTGAQLHKLVAEDGAAGDYFGYSVAIDGNYAIVGAYQDGDNGSYSGSAYIFGPSSPSLLSIDNDSGNVNIMGWNVGIGTTNPQAKLHVHDGYLLISENTDSRENCGGVIGFYSTDMGITATGANFSKKVQAYIGTRTHTYAGTSEAGKDRSEMVFYVGNNADSYGPDRFNFIGTQYMFHVKNVLPTTQDGKQALDYVAGQVSNSDCALFINTNKRVGIGTTSPNYPLHIYGSTNSGTIGNVSYIEYPNLSTAYASNHDVGLRVEKDIWGGQYVLASSDRRIKENIVDVSDNQALSMLRDIPCRYYEYKDKINRGTDKTIGFIAQEVREILPMAVSLQTNVIPNEMRVLTDISWNDTTLYTDLSDCSGIKYRFYVSNDISSNDETMNEVVGNSDNSFTFDQSYNNVFVYGKEVDDFHTVDKNKLFALNFSATQEIDRIQQQQIIDISNANTTIQQQATTIQEQATTIQQQATTIQTLETQIADILTRLSNLENTGSA